MQSIRTHSLRGYLAVIAISAVLVGYIAFLLMTNYYSQIELQRSGSERMRLDTEKHAVAVSYFFSERKNDLKNLTEDRALATFFENKALGMSMEYGLRDSLFNIAKVFSRCINDRKLGEDRIFKRIVFLESHGAVLVDRPEGSSDQAKEQNLEKFLHPEHSGPEIIAASQGPFWHIMVSAHYFFKGAFSGQIIAWVSSETIFHHFLKTPDGTSARLLTIINAKGEPLHSPAGPVQEVGISGWQDFHDLCASPSGKVHRFESIRKDGSKVGMIAVRVPIPDTPFFLVAMAPAAEVLGQTSPRQLLAILGILSLAILGGVAIMVRVNTRNLLLRTRVAEAAERRQEVEAKNRQLEQEIVERQRAEEALLNHVNLMETLLDTIPAPIFYKNTKGIYVGCNQALSDFLGLPKNEIIGKSVYDLYPKEQADKYFAMDTALFQKPGVQVYDFSMRHADGTLRDVNFNKATYSTVDATLAGLVGVMVDITDRKRAEIERLHFSKLDSLSTLSGGIAHDFNNILTAILGNIGLAMLEGQIEPKVRDRLSQAEQVCLRAQTLSKQLLTFAKGGVPIKKIISIPKLLKESAGLTLSGSNALGAFFIPEDLWPVEGDEGQISQVFSNLLINADQAMPEGGIIKISAENFLVEEKSALPLSAGKYLKLTFTDQGVGIPPQYLDKIFDPYFSTKQKGSGLGLATAYSIIKNHHGIIKVKSQVGVGTTFTVYLPATEAEALADEQERLESVRGQGRVLVMDDEQMVREILGRMLDHLGYEVDLTSDGSQAIEKFAEAKEARRPFVAVILDLTIPGGMGGK